MSMEKRPAVWIGTSWKMNKTRTQAMAFAAGLLANPAPPGIRRFVIPPFTALRDVATTLASIDVIVGAQNMHWEDAGAWTGEISGPMLRDCGAALVEIGHSERRTHFGETDATVGLKVAAALRNGLIPLICIGETAAQKAAGRADAVLAAQVEAALAGVGPDDAEVLLAYEPVWAIGAAGTPASPGYANDRQAAIIETASRITGRTLPCLYGGSVTAANCADLITQPRIDGLFIGRAAWEVSGYLDIVARCSAALAAKDAP